MKYRFNDVLLIYSAFITFAVLGTYARVGMSKLSDYRPSYVTPTSTVWPNIVACFLLGAVRHLNSEVPIDSELLPALTIGLCGTMSSFSSFILELFQHSTDQGLYRVEYPNPGYGVMEFISVILIQLLGSGGALILGKTVVSNTLSPILTHPEKLGLTLKYIGIVSRVCCIPIVVSHIVLAVVFDGHARFWTVNALFGVSGALIRFELSKHYNSTVRWFPAGTFIANVLSTTLASVFFLLKYGLKKDGTLLVVREGAADILLDFIVGFCGGMSTLSTFVYEGNAMSFPKACVYYLLSIGICFIICILIVGSYAWTVGIQATELLLA